MGESRHLAELSAYMWNLHIFVCVSSHSKCLSEHRLRFASIMDHDVYDSLDGGEMKDILSYSLEDVVHPKYYYPSPSAVPVNDVAVLELIDPIE